MDVKRLYPDKDNFRSKGRFILQDNIIKLTNSCDCNIPKKSILGHVLALALHLNVFGAGLQPDGPGCPETPSNGHNNHPEQS